MVVPSGVHAILSCPRALRKGLRRGASLVAPAREAVRVRAARGFGLLVFLVQAAQRADRGADQRADARTLAGALPAVGDRAARRADARADRPADRAVAHDPTGISPRLGGVLV